MPPTRRNQNQPLRSEIKPLTADISSDISPTASPESDLSLATHSVVRTNHWKESPYAVGLVELTWADELNKSTHSDSDFDMEANGPNRNCCSDIVNNEMDPTCGCLTVSGLVCGKLGFKRVGNMIVLRETRVEEIGSLHGETVDRTQIVYILGPYWPMLCFVTYPLILGVSYLTASRAVFVAENFNPGLAVVWSLFTFGLCYSLFSVSCKNPGILRKQPTMPEGGSSARWRWNDQVQSFIPRGAYYDPDCAVVVEEFDHTCPWTGTAIGRANMPAFQGFISFLFICLTMDIILLTSASVI